MRKKARRIFSAQNIQRLLHSFRFRLTLYFVGILALILAVFMTLIFFRQIKVIRAETTAKLSAQVNQLSGYFTAIIRSNYDHDDSDHPLQAPPINDQPLITSDEVLALVNPDGSISQKAGQVSDLDLYNIVQQWNKSPTATFPISYSETDDKTTSAKENHTYLFVVSPLIVERQIRGLMILGAPLDPNNQIPTLALVLIVSLVVILLVALIGGYWLADRAMEPVELITRTANHISETELTRRLNLNRKDEMGELALTFDRMLDRIQAAFDRQRQFTADASHELRTPLAIIELETNRALEHRRSQDEYEQTLQVIQSENEWMSRLVNELLTLARMDLGQVNFREEEIDLSELAVDAIDRLSPLAEQNQIKLRTGELNEAVLVANRYYLTQMINNLVENAIKYTANDHAWVNLETGTLTLDGREGCWVKVSDNGPGIPPDQVDHIFERFYRIDKARTRESSNPDEVPSGTGLGLAIVQSIAQAYGGHVSAENAPEGGAIFTIWLPAKH